MQNLIKYCFVIFNYFCFSKTRQIKGQHTGTHAQLLENPVNPTWNYKTIRKNVYKVKPKKAEATQPCDCVLANCGEQCFNRLFFQECPTKGHICDNQKIQRQQWARGIEKFKTENKVSF